MPDNPQRSLAYPATSNPGLRPRNLLNRQLLLNADAAISSGAPIDQLFQPIEDMLSTVAGMAGKVIGANVATAQQAISLVKKRPMMTGAMTVSLAAFLAGGTYYLATRKPR